MDNNNQIFISLFSLSVLCLLVLSIASASAATKPNLVIILADDFGWANIGYHRTNKDYFHDNELDHPEAKTPTLNYLANKYVKLDRFYSYKICAPSRCSLQSGRLPVHVNTVNVEPESYNPKDKESGYAGIPRHMTGIAEKLKGLGYKTHAVGKWDVGMATKDHTPVGRGYESFLGYYHHANDYWSQGITLQSIGNINICLNRFADLSNTDGPEKRLHKSAYEEEILLQQSLDIIESHDTSKPLFLFHSFHLVHTPLQVPKPWMSPFMKMDNENRRLYASMVWYMDHAVASIMTALVTKQMWDNTLLLFFSDNGGPVYDPGSANNYPLRGGKYNDFEGGVRVNAFLAGGVVPDSLRGGNSDYVVDKRAQEHGLPPVDGLNLHDLFTGKSSKSPRKEIHLSERAIISGKYKLILGEQPNGIWQGPIYPNNTGVQPGFPDNSASASEDMKFDCGDLGCLFNIFDDPTEHNDLASSMPDLREQLKSRLAELNKTLFKPDRGEPTLRACAAAVVRHGGFYGPFIDVDGEDMKQTVMSSEA